MLDQFRIDSATQAFHVRRVDQELVTTWREAIQGGVITQYGARLEYAQSLRTQPSEALLEDFRVALEARVYRRRFPDGRRPGR